jgi:hypothetical protein
VGLDHAAEVDVMPFNEFLYKGISIVGLVVLWIMSMTVELRAGDTTECTIGQFCYCVNVDLREPIQQRVAHIRSLLARQRAEGKATGYMSIPLSTLGGSYLPVNAEVAADVKRSVEARFGIRDAWLLNPASSDFTLPSNATGADYMLMWTRVLEGDDGLGKDFDFVYFVGPSDFARYFGLNGRADMEKLSAYYDKRAKSDPELSKVDRTLFRNYYALRASAAFSQGSHDEWNIVRAINEKRRRADKKVGVATQLGVFFDGKALSPAMLETSMAPGDAGECK